MALDSFVVTSCPTQTVVSAFQFVAIHSGIRYTAPPVSYTMSGFSVQSTETVIFPGLIVTILKPGDVIVLVICL